MDFTLAGYTLAASLMVMLAGWLVSIIRRDASVADICWGFSFIAVVWTASHVLEGSGAATWRVSLIAHLVTLWGVRLSLHVFLRNYASGKKHGEDKRYAAMRAKHDNFTLWSLVFIFGLQAVLAWIISLEVQVGMAAEADAFRFLDGIGVAIWLFGFLFETVGDWQLLRFKMDSANQGKVLDTGLWRYTRHPNYFGETVQWWGLFLLALAADGGWWTIISPLLLTFLIIKVSGVSMLEKDLKESKPKYRDYIRRTSAFIPMPPKPKQSGESREDS